VATLKVQIAGQSLPGTVFDCYRAVHLGIQRRSEVTDVVPGDLDEAIFNLTVEAVADEAGVYDFRGPHVHGKRGERFLYLCWGDVAEAGAFAMFRRAKLHLSAIDPRDVAQSVETGATLEGRLGLTDAKGGPLCASIRPPRITWRVGVASVV
jgi:hypothetical protein